MLELLRNRYKETEKVLGKALMDNNGIFMVISGLFPLNTFYTLTAAAILLFSFGILIYTCIYFYTIDSNVSLSSEAAHFSIVVFCGFSFYVVFWFQKDRVSKITKFLENEFYDYGDTIDEETKTEIDEMTTKMKSRKRKISKLMTIIYIVCGFCGVVLFPLVFRKPTANVSNERIFMTTPVVSYFPLTGDTGWYLCLLLTYTSTFLIVMNLNGSDVAFCCFSEEGCNQLSILCLTVRCALRRASYFKELQGLFAWCVMVVMMAGALMLCLSGIYFFLDVVDFGTKVSFMFYLSGELMHTFVYAWYGQQMSERSAEIRDVLYEVEWEECSSAVKPYILIMQAYTNTPMKLKGGGLMEYNLNTFGNVCSSAYSYFNLLSAAVHSESTT